MQQWCAAVWQIADW